MCPRLVGRIKSHRHAVHAIAQARGGGAIGKHMAQMRVAARAVHLGAAHEPAIIDAFAHSFRRYWRVERRPARARFKLGRLIEQRRIAAQAAKGSGGFGKVIMRARPFGAVLSRDQLLERVWGYEYLGDSRLVDAHVRRLRVKIEDQPDEPKLLITVRGLGYRLLG